MIALNPNMIDLRAHFNKPTGAFIAHVKIAGSYTDTSTRSPIHQDTACRAGRDCVVVLGPGDVVSITIGNQTKTFVGVPTDANGEHN